VAPSHDADINQIRRTGHLEHVEGPFRCHYHGADAKRRPERMNETSQRATKTETDACLAATADADREHHQVVRARRNRYQGRSGEKSQQDFHCDH
jgi:hypothetical protein